MKQLPVALGLMLFGVMAGYTQDASLRTKHFNLDDGLAIQGYDPVAYFTQGKAVKGAKTYAHLYQGTTYYFASAAHKAAFQKDPSQYEPQYGGWCAYAMGAKGEKVSVDPKTFKITGGKLYLFYNRFFNNTLEDWNKDEAALKNKANASWQKIVH